jgi:hypothetical protein
MQQKRIIELVISIILLLLCAGLLVWSKNFGATLDWASLPEKVAFALVVALVVRWLTVLFQEVPETRDIYASTGAEIRKAISGAKEHIWILQTWLPGVAGDATLILDNRDAGDVRILLASFVKDSPIYARIKTRYDLLVGSGSMDIIESAMNNSAGSALPFQAKGKKDCVRFTGYHHPGWIAIIDNEVYWGATPLDKDNWNVPQVCYHASKKEPRAAFWVEQFTLMWKGKDPLTKKCLSHSFDEEKKYNHRLARDSHVVVLQA